MDYVHDVIFVIIHTGRLCVRVVCHGRITVLRHYILLFMGSQQITG